MPEIPAALKDSITINYLEELKKLQGKNIDADKAGLEVITTQIFLKEMKDTTEYLNKRYGNSGITSPEGREAINTYLFYLIKIKYLYCYFYVSILLSKNLYL